MQLEADEDPFMESDERIAAQVRQLFPLAERTIKKRSRLRRSTLKVAYV